MLLKMSFNTTTGTLAGMLESWQAQVQQAGYRLTQPRRAILEVMAEVETALTAAEVHRLAGDRHPHVGLVTVYRTLSLLEELRLVRRLYTETGTQVYVRADPQQPGHHLICQACHRAVEFPCTGMESVVKDIEQQTGFDVRGHWLELFGLCPACLEKGAV